MDVLEIRGELNALKALLAASDYKCLKYVDGALGEDDYAEIKKRRAEWRAKINELENAIDAEFRKNEGGATLD